MPNHSEYAEPGFLVELAATAEGAGWDGFFLWDHIWFADSRPTADPWIALGAIAAATKRVRLGALVTPLARRRPWKLARETVTLDRLSSGRLTIGVGLGVPRDFVPFGERWDPPEIADRLDEGLELLRAFWSQEPVSTDGRHFRVGAPGSDREPGPLRFRPGPFGASIPIWGAARVDSPPRTLRRAAGLDGVAPVGSPYRPGIGVTAGELAETVTRLDRLGIGPSYEIVRIGDSRRDPPAEYDAELVSGCGRRLDWWLDELHPELMTADQARAHLLAGPPAA